MTATSPKANISAQKEEIAELDKFLAKHGHDAHKK
jgi:hypothetical protein